MAFSKPFPILFCIPFEVAFCLTSISLQGMDHNLGLTDAEDVALYLSRDLHKGKDRKAPPPYEIIRDEVVGR